jgi:hypothetical protein
VGRRDKEYELRNSGFLWAVNTIFYRTINELVTLLCAETNGTIYGYKYYRAVNDGLLEVTVVGLLRKIITRPAPVHF